MYVFSLDLDEITKYIVTFQQEYFTVLAYNLCDSWALIIYLKNVYI